ncbi:MAG TPA: hypothetical protein VF271_08885 [Rhodanobacteraceae bacterium]
MAGPIGMGFAAPPIDVPAKAGKDKAIAATVATAKVVVRIFMASLLREKFGCGMRSNHQYIR